MLHKFLKSRRILAILLVAMLALVQARIAFAGCIAADAASAAPTAVMENCPGCKTNTVEADSYDTLSRVCSNHCLQSAASGEQIPAQPVLAVTSVALVMPGTAPPLILSHAVSYPSGKTRLIYRLQRLLI